MVYMIKRVCHIGYLRRQFYKSALYCKGDLDNPKAKELINKWRTVNNHTSGLVGGPSEIKLRKYQEECIEGCIKALKSGKRRLAVSLATGGGKTVIFCSLINHVKPLDSKQGDKVLILVHRKELAQQAIKMCGKLMPTKTVDMELGANHARPEADIIVASIQSLNTRLQKYDPSDFKMIIIDEAHHAAARTYSSILGHFDANSPSSRIAVVGFSATFVRHDRKSLTNALDTIVFQKDLMDMIQEGWLCDAKFSTVRNQVNLDNVPVRGGDFAVSRLSDVINNPIVNDLVLQTYLKFCRESDLKSTLLFGVDVAHIKTLNELFVANGVVSEIVTGSTSLKNRDEILERFKQGKIKVLMNCGVFTEGTDIPNVDCILLTRPTKSSSLLLQMIGRGLRLHPGKKHCHIIDFVCSNNDLVSVPTLAGLDTSTELNKQTITDMELLKSTLDTRAKKKDKEAFIEQLGAIFPNIQNGTSRIETFDSLQDYMFNEHVSPKSTDLPDLLIFKLDSLPWLRKSPDIWGIGLCNHKYYISIVRELLTPPSIDGTPNYQYRAISYTANQGFVGYTSALILEPTSDLKSVIKAIHARLIEMSYFDYKRTLRNSQWRSLPATYPQKSFVDKKLKKIAAKIIPHLANDKAFRHKCSDFVEGLQRGAAFDLIFSNTFSGQKYFRATITLLAKYLEKKRLASNYSHKDAHLELSKETALSLKRLGELSLDA